MPSCRRLQRYSTVREVNFEEVFILHPDARKILGHGRPVRLAPSPTFHGSHLKTIIINCLSQRLYHHSLAADAHPPACLQIQALVADDMDSMQLHSLASGQLLLIGSLPDYYLVCSLSVPVPHC